MQLIKGKHLIGVELGLSQVKKPGSSVQNCRAGARTRLRLPVLGLTWASFGPVLLALFLFLFLPGLENS
jgi:hypothetical protein